MGEKNTALKSPVKLNYKKTLLIGFGFLASSVAWAIYDPYVTTILNEMLSKSSMVAGWSEKLVSIPFLLDLLTAQGEDIGSAATGFTLVPLFVGIIMTFDNIFGVIFQPLFGKLSDRTRSKYGKRRPFIFIGAPLAAIFFALIPRMTTIPTLMICVIMFVFIMSTWRSPVVALMPDLTPSEVRSEGNAIINLCGGLGGLIGMVGGSVIAAVGGLDAKTGEERPWIFLLGSVIMVLGTIVLFFFVPEKDTRIKTEADKNIAMAEEAKDKMRRDAEKAEKKRLREEKLSKGEKKSLIFMLIGLFFLFMGANSIQTFFALFAAEQLGLSTAQATILMAIFALSSMIAAIPAGKIGHKFGRKKAILGGLIVFMVAFVLYAILGQMGSDPQKTLRILIYFALIIGGFANMVVTVNTLPLVLEIGGESRIGTFTGYYYTATFSAQIVAPILYGIVRVISGNYMSLFIFCPVMFAIAIFFVSLVRHGEVNTGAITDEMVEEIEMANE